MGKRTYSHFDNENREKLTRKVVNDAANAIAKADKALIDGTQTAEDQYTRWFGPLGLGNPLRDLQQRIHKMNYAMNHGNIDVTYNQHCAGPNPPYASASHPAGGEQTYHEIAAVNNWDVDLCPPFFSKLTERGKNSMMVTIIHEFSHAVLSTTDAIHPITHITCDNHDNALTLVPAYQILALNNAENIAQFICAFAGI